MKPATAENTSGNLAASASVISSTTVNPRLRPMSGRQFVKKFETAANFLYTIHQNLHKNGRFGRWQRTCSEVALFANTSMCK
jgi:hypothetical protein